MKAPRRKRTKINIGDTFNRLTVLEFVDKQNSHKRYKVKCVCGTEKLVQGTHLISGNIRSCGCLHTEIRQKAPGLSGLRKKYNQYKANARNNERKFELTFEEFLMIVKKDCFYCGEKPKRSNYYINSNGSFNDKKITQYGADRAWFEANGIDRIDSDKDYTLDNTLPCCFMCNEMKSYHDKELYLNKIKSIYKHLKLDQDIETQIIETCK